MNFVAPTLVIYGQEVGNRAKKVEAWYSSLARQSPGGPTPKSPDPEKRKTPLALSCAKPEQTLRA
jgi:hypothetical protein